MVCRSAAVHCNVFCFSNNIVLFTAHVQVQYCEWYVNKIENYQPIILLVYTIHFVHIPTLGNNNIYKINIYCSNITIIYRHLPHYELTDCVTYISQTVKKTINDNNIQVILQIVSIVLQRDIFYTNLPIVTYTVCVTYYYTVYAADDKKCVQRARHIICNIVLYYIQ